jgi:solute carrier family 25 (adenine nucleotide translocator) protein 4/5/6/31
LAAILSALTPLELAKSRIQTTNELIAAGSLRAPYTGAVDCLRKVIKYEGTTAMWKGNMLGIARFFPSESLNCFMKNQFRNIFSNTLSGNICAGVLGGWLSSCIFYPIDTVRIFLSTSTSPGLSSLHQIKENLKIEGIRYLYRGMSNSLLSVAIFRGTFFGVYDSFKIWASSFEGKFLIGYFSGLTAGALVYPVETIRKRQILSKSSVNIKYIWNIYNREGIRGFYKGMSVGLVQSLGGAAVLLYFDH